MGNCRSIQWESFCPRGDILPNILPKLEITETGQIRQGQARAVTMGQAARVGWRGRKGLSLPMVSAGLGT